MSMFDETLPIALHYGNHILHSALVCAFGKIAGQMNAQFNRTFLMIEENGREQLVHEFTELSNCHLGLSLKIRVSVLERKIKDTNMVPILLIELCCLGTYLKKR